MYCLVKLIISCFTSKNIYKEALFSNIYQANIQQTSTLFADRERYVFFSHYIKTQD